MITGYLARYGRGAAAGKVVTLATPYRGSFEAVLQVATGTANLGSGEPASRDREAARLTPALHHLLPAFKNGLVPSQLPADALSGSQASWPHLPRPSGGRGCPETLQKSGPKCCSTIFWGRQKSIGHGSGGFAPPMPVWIKTTGWWWSGPMPRPGCASKSRVSPGNRSFSFIPRTVKTDGRIPFRRNAATRATAPSL